MMKKTIYVVSMLLVILFSEHKHREEEQRCEPPSGRLSISRSHN
jgi:hypothetical protein